MNPPFDSRVGGTITVIRTNSGPGRPSFARLAKMLHGCRNACKTNKQNSSRFASSANHSFKRWKPFASKRHRHRLRCVLHSGPLFAFVCILVPSSRGPLVPWPPRPVAACVSLGIHVLVLVLVCLCVCACACACREWPGSPRARRPSFHRSSSVSVNGVQSWRPPSKTTCGPTQKSSRPQSAMQTNKSKPHRKWLPPPLRLRHKLPQ